MTSTPPEGSDYPQHQRIPRPGWFDDLREDDHARVAELLVEIDDLAGQLRQLGDVVDLDIALWDEQDRGSAVSALRALAAHGRENANLHMRLAVCFERLARTIVGPAESAWHEEPEEPTGGEG